MEIVTIKRIYEGLTDYLNLTGRGIFILPFCTTPDEIGDQGVKLAESLAESITA